MSEEVPSPPGEAKRSPADKKTSQGFCARKRKYTKIY